MKRAAILLFLLVAAAYGNSVLDPVALVRGKPFFNEFLWDDFDTITENPSIRSWRGIGLIFQPERYFRLSGEIGWRPLTSLTFYADYAIYGLKPWGYHLTNLLLHYLCCLLLYAFLKDIAPESVSLCAAALFAVHPLNTEVVDAISFRDDLLCLLFMLAALKLANKRRGSFALPAAALYFLALLSKEMAYPLPLILIVCDVVTGRRFRPAGRVVSRYLPLALVAILFTYLRFGLFLNPLEAEYGFYGGGVENRILIIPELLFRYLMLLLFPVNLSADHAFPVPLRLFSASPQLRLFLAAEIICVGALAVAVIAAALSRTRRDLLFAFLFFVLTFGMISNIAPLPNIIAERYLYIPSVSFCIVVAALFAERRRWRLALIVVVVAYIVLTARRNLDWRNEEALWASTAEISPGSFRAHNHMGLIRAGQGRIEVAVQHYERSLAINPRNGQTHNNLGLACLRLGQFEKAEQSFHRALQIKSDDASAYNNLGNLFGRKGDRAEARRHYERAVQINPRLSQARFNLAALHEAGGDYPSALGHIDAVIGYYPERGGAWLMKGRLLDEMGRRGQAIPCYEKALSLSPGDSSIYVLLGNAYFLQGRYDDALAQFGKAARFSETTAGAHLNLGNCYMKKGDIQKAIGEYRRALQAGPSMWKARSNLGIAYQEAGRVDEAIGELEHSLKINPRQEEIRLRLEKLKSSRGVVKKM